MHSRRLGRTGLSVSRLGLGTAEIGFAYGLGSPSLPSEEEAIHLLRTAVEKGVTFFDTANYYGLAEERIGKSGILKDPRVVVCTKCAQFLEKGEYFESNELERKIREQVEASLRNLRVDALPLLLLHGPSAEQMDEGILSSLMRTLQNEGKVRAWGASTRGDEPALATMHSGADVIQVAYSIADRRMAERVLPYALEQEIGVINRSAYLKGAFAGKAVYLGGTLSPLKATVAQAERVAESLGVPLTELALRYTLSEPALSTTLVGTARTSHLLSAIDAIERGPLPEDALKDLRSLAIDDPEQVDPARWPK